jgi:hypothetical protein
MHSPATALETLNILWENYLSLAEKVDIEAMLPDTFAAHVEQRSPMRPLRIGSWVVRQGFFIAAWALWEYYSQCLCDGLPNKTKKQGGESTVDWVKNSLAANSIVFDDYQWFSSANCLRNLIAHYGARATSDMPKAKKLTERSRKAFPDLEEYRDGYISLQHEHLADLAIKIEDFIKTSARDFGQGNAS